MARRKFLKKIGSERAVEPLIQALKDKFQPVRFEAVSALRMIGDKKAIEPLIETLKDENPSVRGLAVEALEEMRDSRAVEPLIQALEDEKSGVRKKAADALKRLEDKKAVEPLIKALKHKNSYVRAGAADVLEKIGSERAVEPLIQALKDEDGLVRAYAAEALKKMGAAPGVEEKVSKSFTEKNNMGTRYDTLDKVASYWWTRNMAQKFDPFVMYIFDNGADAHDALLELDCIHVAEDTGNLICTETLIFGYYATEDGRYEAFMCGEELTPDLWVKTKKSFEKHGGHRKNELEPEEKVISESKKIQTTSEVVFVKEYSEERMGFTYTYHIYKAPDEASAKAFLQENPVNRVHYYVIVETPEGNWGRDIDGIYKE